MASNIDLLLAREIICSGTVQGVFFRASATQKAIELGITGYVRNESNGNVFIHAEGEEQQLIQLIEWCHSGPKNAKVKAVQTDPVDPQGFETFQIKY